MLKEIHTKHKVHPSVKRIFYIIGGFFIVFFVAVGYTIYLAQKNFEPVMDKRYYEKGLNYEKRKNEFLKARQKDWKVYVNFLDKDTINKNYLLEIHLSNQNNIKDFFSNPERNVVDLKISLPATIKRHYEFQFVEKDFKINNNSVILQKEIQIPVPGLYEFRLELRPENDAAIFYSKKLYVE
ncbi:MAG: hypothetical protein KatS3mg129_2665 [Leptospiraceae bacterium]|nr:MAG: hypothetical protein KatS3mg129_2665 [Leptospiraceae bacterium]